MQVFKCMHRVNIIIIQLASHHSALKLIRYPSSLNAILYIFNSIPDLGNSYETLFLFLFWLKRILPYGRNAYIVWNSNLQIFYVILIL